MRIGRLAGWRRALLLLTLLPSCLTQSSYDSETQPIQQPFTPRGYQPPPQPARYPVPAPAPRFQPHNAVGYQPPPQPALYENHQHYEQPSRPVYRPVAPQRPAHPQYHQEPHRPAPAYEPEPSRPSYESVPIQVPQHRPDRPAPQPQQPSQYEAIPQQPHRPASAYESVPAQIPQNRPAPQKERPSQYEAIPQQPHRPASQPPPVSHRPAPAPRPAYEPEPEHPSQYEAVPSPSRPPQRPAPTYPPKPSRPAYEPEPERPSPYEAQSVPSPSHPPQRPVPTYPPELFIPPRSEEVPNPYDFTPDQRPQQRPEQTRQPPSIEPTGTFHPAPGTQPGEGEGLNVMIHVFINEKLPAGVTTEAPGPMPPPQSLPPHIASMHFPHSSMPLTFTRDFDRTKNRFLMDDEEDQQQEGPANIVEIKAVVDSSDAAMDMRIGKAMAKELDRAVPAILGRIHDKTSRLDEGLRNQLEQELISEISKNLGGHLEQSSDVSEKEISDLIEEGLKELENESTPSPPQTPQTRPAPTTRPSAPPSPSQTTVHSTHSTRPATTSETLRTSSPPPSSNPPSTAATTHAHPPALPPATAASPAPSSRAPAPPATSTATTTQPLPPAPTRPTQSQPPATKAPTVTQPTAPPATVQWWTPTTPTPAAPSTEATAPPAQHHEADTTTQPTPPLATMRTFPTETLPQPVTQPTLKVPESVEETNENIDETPFNHKGDDFPTEQPNATETSKEEEKILTSECSIPRNSSDTTKADVLFLLDSSNTFNQEKFNGALELIANTTGHFMNIGPDGIQVSLIQFASEPQLEFSLRRHNCLPMLIEDIKGTEHLKGASMLGHAIDKATRLAFTRERGDRLDAENILIIVTDGATEDKVQQPVTVAKENGVAVLVISTIEADPEVVLEMAGTAENVFKMDGMITEPLSTRLAQRIRDTASGYHIPEQRFPTFNENKDESTEEKKKEHEGAEKPKEEGSTTELPSTLMSGEVTQEMLPPPKNLKLVCTRKSLGINIELSGAFHGWLYIEGQREKDNCSMKVEKEEGKAFRHVHFEAGIEECDIANIQSESPAGINSSAVVSIVKHPKAVSIDDKAYLLECFVASAVETTLDAHLEVVGGIKKTIAEAFSLDVVPPKCHYTIRKGSPEGPEVEKADLGEVVFHRWDCDGGDEAYDVFGMHIHDCYASSDVEQQFPILDSNGCSSNTNLLSAPVYAEGALSVYAESRAFAVENDQQDLKFQCKVSLCTRDGDGCEGITPPHCSGNATDLLVSRRLRHNQAVDSALTSAVATSVGLTTAAVSRFSPILIVCAIVLAIAIGLISAVRLKSCRARSTSRPIVTSPSMEEIYVTVPGRAPIRTTAPNPAMTEFMKNFDRSRYV